MAAFQKQGSGLQSGPGKRCSTDSPDSSSLLGRKEVASRKQGRMFLSSIHMTSAQRQMSEVQEFRLVQQESKEHLNGSGGTLLPSPSQTLCSACGVCRDR